MRCFGMLIDGRARPTGLRQRGTEATLLIALNAHHDVVEFSLPAAAGDGRWNLLLDTNLPEIVEPYTGVAGDQYSITARSLLMFVLSQG